MNKKELQQETIDVLRALCRVIYAHKDEPGVEVLHHRARTLESALTAPPSKRKYAVEVCLRDHGALTPWRGTILASYRLQNWQKKDLDNGFELHLYGNTHLRRVDWQERRAAWDATHPVQDYSNPPCPEPST